MHTLIVRTLGILALLLATNNAAAQSTLYVNGATGSDAVLRASNSASTPWKTIGRAAWGSTNRQAPNAAEAAKAGDTVEIAAGAYDFGGSIKNRWGVVYNPVNQGTSASSAITFVAQGTVTLTAPSTHSPVIGCDERSYVVWRGPFSLNEINITVTADTGPVVMHAATGCGVDGILVNGNGAPDFVDNHTCVRFEACTNCYVRNSTLTNIRHARRNHNGSGVMLYDSYNTLIEHNLIHDVDNAIYIKGVQFGKPQSGTIVRFNEMANCDECMTVLASKDARIYQNVIRDSEFAINFTALKAEPLSHPTDDWFVNNTIDRMSIACVFPSGGAWHQQIRIWNNVFTNCRTVNYREEGAFGVDQGLSWEHNVYSDYGVFSRDGSSAAAFTEWQSSHSQDRALPASISADPRFANGAAHDFRLCMGPAKPVANCRTTSGAALIAVDLLDLNHDGKTTDLIAAGAFVTNLERIGPESAPARVQK